MPVRDRVQPRGIPNQTTFNVSKNDIEIDHENRPAISISIRRTSACLPFDRQQRVRHPSHSFAMLLVQLCSMSDRRANSPNRASADLSTSCGEIEDGWPDRYTRCSYYGPGGSLMSVAKAVIESPRMKQSLPTIDAM